mgnify:CR=1 FL=1
MSCECDGEAPELFNEKVRKARKQYKCCECYSIIEKREKYILTKGKIGRAHV